MAGPRPAAAPLPATRRTPAFGPAGAGPWRDQASSRLIDQKQQRIDQLESLLEEFKDGLQDLLAESARKDRLMRESEDARAALAVSLAEHAQRIADLVQRCEALETHAASAMERERAVLDFAARQIDRLTRDESASAAMAERSRQAREEVERFHAGGARAPQPDGRATRRWA